MSITWLDTPGVPVSRVETLSFSATLVVTAISVSFSGTARSEERAYRDGQFVYPYHGSTQVGSVYNLVRSGGWPADPKVYVDEEPAPFVTAWSTLYEADLTTSGSATYASNGTYTIDGQSWSIHKGSTNNAAITLGATGLQINPADGDAPTWHPGAYTAPYAALHVSGLAGFDSTKQHAVLMRITSSAMMSGGDQFAGVSQFKTTDVSNSTVSSVVGLSGGQHRPRGTGSADFLAENLSTTLGNVVVAVVRHSAVKGSTWYGSWTGAFPVVEALLPNRTYITTYAGAVDELRAGFVCGGFACPVFRLTHIKVLQK